MVVVAEKWSVVAGTSHRCLLYPMFVGGGVYPSLVDSLVLLLSHCLPSIGCDGFAIAGSCCSFVEVAILLIVHSSSMVLQLE